MLIETEHPTFGTITQVSSAVRVGNEPAAHRRAPRRNEHARDVLEDLLGYTPKHRRHLDRAGAFGPAIANPTSMVDAHPGSGRNPLSRSPTPYVEKEP